MSKRKNLNKLFSQTIQTKRSCPVNCGSANVQVVFSNIETVILEHLSDPHCQNVAILGPYFSNQKILKECSKKEGCSIVTTKDKYMKSKVRMDAFNSLSPLLDARVKTLNAGRGRNKTLMHTKAVILLDYEKRPYKVITGSFNFTQNAQNNIENITVFRDPIISKLFYEEFERIFKVSKLFL